MEETKKTSLVKPTLGTPFHIDFTWWQQTDREWRVYLRSLLCSEHQEVYADIDADETIDWVDPETAEVHQVDGLQHVLISHCSQRDNFLQEHTALVEAIFRLFMQNGNSPMNVEEIAQKLNRPAQPILKMLSGHRVYRGLRPILD
jgi:hypothetical protein